MTYVYSIRGCPEEGTGVLHLYRIKKNYIISTRQIKCSVELQNQIYKSSDKDQRKLLRRLYNQ